MMADWRNLGCGLALLALVAGCSSANSGSEQTSTSSLSIARTALTQIIAQRQQDRSPQPAPDPSRMAAEALSVNPGPLIMVGLEGMGTTQVMAMTGNNAPAGTRTYMTSNEQAVIMRGFMLSGTRGLGNDLSVAEASGAAALVAAGRSGPARRTMRYYSGDGLERPLVFDCEVGPGPKAGVMVEHCAGHGVRFENSYLPGSGVSRQWIGPALGYATIQVLRN